MGLIADAFVAEQNSSVTLNITSVATSTVWGAIRVYVDLNGDYEFGEGENVARIGDANDGEGAKSVNQEITITAAPGTYLMRVFYVARSLNLQNHPTATSATQDLDSTDPYGSYFEGGFYDFAFNVVAAEGGATGLSSAQAAAFRAVASETGLRVSGVPAGETISVYTVNSVLVATATAAEGVTELAVPAQGVLLVRAGNQVVKVVK